MNEQQRRLARHALGLDASSKSYRNRYQTVGGTFTARCWQDMVASGDARLLAPTFLYFELTEQGARKVLQDGETLDPDDFPN